MTTTMKAKTTMTEHEGETSMKERRLGYLPNSDVWVYLAKIRSSPRPEIGDILGYL